MSANERNLLLASLPRASRELVISHAEAVPLPVLLELYEAGQEPPYIYFLSSGVASIVTTMTDGTAAEVGLIGREGIVGGVHLLGPLVAPTGCFMQLDGHGIRVPLQAMRRLFGDSVELRARILEFLQQQIFAVSQIAACHRLHESNERLARWLLMMQDRAEEDVLNLTQDFLGLMLGARRTTITASAGMLQRNGLIEYSRGHVRILDRGNLEAVACDCYPIIRQLDQQLYTAM